MTTENPNTARPSAGPSTNTAETKNRLTLSGETPSADVLGEFDGVGLLRSEFILRRLNAYITEPDAAEALSCYLSTIAGLCAPRDVWFRSSDLWSDEANVLRGVDQLLREENPFIGQRGVRRRAVSPEALDVEINVVRDVAQDHPNLHWLSPFVAVQAEFHEVLKLLDTAGWPNRVGTMLETPAAALDAEGFVNAGATNLLVGLNDLTSLFFGAARGNPLHDKLHPQIWVIIDKLHDVTDRCEWGIGGTLSADIMAQARHHRIPYVTVHYSELPDVLGTDPARLPELGLVRQVKRGTRDRIGRVRMWDFTGLDPAPDAE